MSLTPGEATAEDPAVREDAEPDLAGCVHAVGIHPKVVYEALHLDLQMPWAPQWCTQKLEQGQVSMAAGVEAERPDLQTPGV